MKRFPAEWEPQDAVLFAWPDVHTDWASQLNAVQQTYLAIFDALLNYSHVVLLVQASTALTLRKKLETQFGNHPYSIYLFKADYNDTWARDFGPITVKNNHSPEVLNFGFDGWGGKFDATLDNTITSELVNKGVLSVPSYVVDLVLEGGGIETDGNTTLLTTSRCLLNNNRNQNLSREDKKNHIEDSLRGTLGVKTILWLDHGYLAGDDTDSHIDTLARFSTKDTIVYVKCDEVKDEHFRELSQMEAQLKTFTTEANEPFTLIPLPLPSAIFSTDGDRLPATYANFLISNGVVLAPTYNDVADKTALSQLKKAFPSYCVIGVDCRSLIEQRGSLHCISMQLLKNTVDFGRLDQI
ncbi:MAG: agmatine deiminase family protein [Agarilytica sp.]